MRIGRDFDPLQIGVTRGLQLLRHEAERSEALATRLDVLRAIGGLARGAGAETYHHIGARQSHEELDDAALLGTPEDIIARLKALQRGGVALVLLVDPRPSIETLRRFAGDIMPEFS